MNDSSIHIRGYIYSKTVDLSTLNQGISIPITIQNDFYMHLNRVLKRGEKTEIRIILDGEIYKANLINQAFNKTKYPKHKDMLQIRYTRSSQISMKLKEIFFESNNYINHKRELNISQNSKQLIKIPDNLRETIVLYESDYEDTFIAECITLNDYNLNKASDVSEDEYELFNNIYKVDDARASIVIKNGDYKIRKLNRNIAICLKEFYDYRCQICGKRIGSKYNVTVVESHHIVPFSLTQDNSIKNQIIVCPNHHRIIHAANPKFDRINMAYLYNSGNSQDILLNKHL